MKILLNKKLNNRRNKVTLTDVEKFLPLKTWWASLLVLPVSNRLVILIVNRSSITPNQITILSLLLRIGSGIAFFGGTRVGLIAGAVCYYFAYVLDCVDGCVARITGKASEFGRYLDHLSDLFGDIFILCCLASGQGILFSEIVISMVFCHIVEYYVSFLTSFIIRSANHMECKNTNFLLTPIKNYRDFFFKKNFKSFLSFPDYEAVVFIFFPLAGNPVLGIKSGFYLVLVIVLYTIFSSFITIMTGGDKFP